MSEWKEVTLGSMLDIKHGYAFPGEGITTEETDHILVTPGNFEIGGGFKASKFKYFQGDIPQEYVLSEGDLIVTMTDLSRDGDTLGYSALVPKIDGKNFLHNQRIGLVSVKDDEVSDAFLHWLMRSRKYRFYVLGSATGSTVRHTSPDRIKRIEIEIPSDRQEQETIADILSSLDEKIELNRKQNRSLEAIAQALFKRWFVEFEFPDENGRPYKSSGGAIQPSELGEIPVGWGVGALGDVVEQRSERVTPSQETRDMPYVPIDCISPASLSLRESKDGEEAQSSLIRFYEDDILFGAMRPYFHKVCIAPFAGTTRTTCFVLKPRSSDDFAYATLLLHDAGTIDFATKHSTGSTIPYAKWEGSLDTMKIVLPPPAIRKDFNELVYPLLSRIPPRYFENQSLAQIRDTLLPKLTSGELRVA